MGLDHRVGYPLPFGLAHRSSRWTEGSRRYLDGFQYGGKHGSGLLPETSLCRGGPITAREQEVVNGRQACILPGVVEASPLVVSQYEVTVAPFHIRAGALAHVSVRCRLLLQPVLLHWVLLPSRPPGLQKRCLDAISKCTKRLPRHSRLGGGHALTIR